MKLETKLLSSIDKVFPNRVDSSLTLPAVFLANAPFSFQVAFRLAETGVCPIYVRVESDLPLSVIAEYKIGFVPVIHSPEAKTENYYDVERTGMIPDPLLRRQTDCRVADEGFWRPRYFEENEKCLLNAVGDSWQGLWFTINEDGTSLEAGQHTVTVRFYESATAGEIGSQTLILEILPAVLPPQKLLYTSWFHCDCLADLYGVEMFSDRHFEIIRSYAAEAAKTGMNMILLPAFTPPLDTSVGKERPTAQLVGVEKTADGYVFDFTLLERYVEICRSVGVTHFEHSHFFTQWGCHHAPKVIATANGEKTRIFGWDTDALSEEYIGFLKAYLAALMPELDKLGLRDKLLFHISDEPVGGKDGDYVRAYEAIKDAFCGIPSGDALSHYSIYERSNADIPIVAVDSKDMPRFCENCKNFWLYYTGSQGYAGFPNRVTTNRALQNRIIGLFLYLWKAKGFLHWGYNYYYDFMSHGIHNPLLEPGVFDDMPGTSYMVYPAADGTAIPSARMKVQYEGFCDHRAFLALEEKIGREAVISLVEAHLGRDPLSKPHTNASYLALMREVTERLGK